MTCPPYTSDLVHKDWQLQDPEMPAVSGAAAG